MTTRRDLLRAVAAIGGAVLLGDLGRGRRGPGEAATPPETIAYRWRDPAVKETLAAEGAPDEPAAAPGERAYTSAIYRAPGVFNAIGSLWTGQLAALEVRASADGADWTPWHDVDSGEQSGLGASRDGRSAGDLFTGAGWRYAQYRARVPAGQPPPDVELVLIDSSRGPEGPVSAESAPLGATATRPTIISRAGWGCYQGYRNWPPEYRTVQKGIIHHTATSEGGAEVVRAIYRYHADDLGWGDIGYNYLVDRWGNIYEGRYGGENVVAGHALQYNWGSTGIACIGNFESATPGEQMKDALARITAWTCRNLDPHGQSWFVDGVYPNILGHRDVLSTACPGRYLYSYLPALRDAVARIRSGCVSPAWAAAQPAASTPAVSAASYPNRVYLPLVMNNYCE